MINQQSQSSYIQQQAMNKSFQYTDEELIARFQKGDEQSYIELVKRYKDKLINFVFRLVSDRDQAEDIIQDTMLKLYTHKHYYKNIAKFSTWIYTIAGNLAKTELRKNKRRKVTNLSDMGSDDWEFEIPAKEDTAEEVHNQFDGEQINKAIQTLPDHFREVIILRDIQELSYEEVSNIVEVPLGTVKSRINRARLQLQEMLKELR